MNIAPKPPLARQGQQLASHGRYGDTQLVHMNPYEVQGLAAMSPTGQLTKNPVTGQPEAFLPMLAPIIGSVVGKAALGKAIGSGLAGAIGSGLATWAQTGDFEKGVISGVTGFGLGKVLGAGTDVVNQDTAAALQNVDAAQQAVQTAGTDVLKANQMLPTEAMMAEATTPPMSVDPFDPSNLRFQQAAAFSPEQTAYASSMAGLDSAQAGLEAARQNVTAGDMFRSFTDSDALTAMGKKALSPDALLPIAVGEGTQAQVAQQDAMAQMQKDNEREDAAYAQGFKDVLTDSLGMARGSEPNPYSNFYSAKGGRMPSYNGGGQLEADNFIDPLAEAGLGAVSGVSYGLDKDNRYFIRPRKGSGGERQAYLRGDFKLDPPSDYRHGFEEEFQFFDYIGDRDVPRELDTFGAGASDYLAGLLAAGDTGAPTAPGTSPLATYDTVRADQFSGVDNFGDYGVGDLPPAPDLPDITDTVVQGTLGGDAVVSDTQGGGTGDDTVTGDDTNTVKDTGVTVDPTPDYIKALDALNIAKDGDYDRPEGESVYDVMQDYGVTDDQIAEYYGVDAAGVAEAADVIGGGRTLADAGLSLADEYAQTEVDQVYDMLTAGDVSLAAAADYFQTSGDEILANMGAIADARKLESEQLENLSAYGSTPQIETQETINDLVDGIESNMFTVDQVAAQYGLEADAVQAEYDRIRGARDAEAALVAAAAANPVAAVPNLDFSAVDTSGMNIDPTAFYGTEGAATGGQIGKKRFMTRMGEVELAEGGLADVPVSEEFMQEIPPEQMMMEETTVVEEMPDIDYNDLIAMTVEAIKGNAENADEIINLFIEEFGTEKFQQLREAVLQSIVPDAQTEGMIAGDSGGMADEVMGMIGEEQPVAVSPGEYIVAADVVSGLGDGNSDAGADVLDEMMQNVRNARSGGRQPSPIDKSAVMPA